MSRNPDTKFSDLTHIISAFADGRVVTPPRDPDFQFVVKVTFDDAFSGRSLLRTQTFKIFFASETSMAVHRVAYPVSLADLTSSEASKDILIRNLPEFGMNLADSVETCLGFVIPWTLILREDGIIKEYFYPRLVAHVQTKTRIAH